MSLWEQFETLTLLAAYVGAWWLALWVVFRIGKGPFSWVPVAVVTFGIPLMAADLAAQARWQGASGWFVHVWAAVPVVIDGVWAISRLRDRLVNPKESASRGEAATGL